MYASVSTQQPAAICALKSSADAVHVLEAVRVGLVPRVTRRLTGHERGQIRPGTVWVWEEEECNMKRWTDGRRWGASRVGGGGFLVYTESSDVNTPPDSRAHSPNTFAQINGYYPSVPQREPLIKQTYSTTMKHPITGKAKKFHVVGYSSKNNPQGDGQNSLPLPHQLPMLSTLQVAPGIWPEVEKRRDSTAASSEAGGSEARKPVTARANPPSPPPRPPQPAAESVAGPSKSATSTPRGPSSAPPSQVGDRTNLPSPYGTPYFYPPAPRSAPPYQSPQILPTSERYHPYRERPACLAPIEPFAPVPPTIPNEGRRVSAPSSTHPVPLSAPPHHPGIPTYPYPLPGPSHIYLPQAVRPPFNHQMMPPIHPGPPQMYPDPFNPYGHNHNPYPYQSHHHPVPQPHHQARHPPPRELIHPADQPSTLEPNLPNRSPQISISSALSSDTANSGRMTLPPLRVAIDGAGHRRTPSQSSRTSPGQSPLAGDRRELGELSKKVSL